MDDFYYNFDVFFNKINMIGKNYTEKCKRNNRIPNSFIILTIQTLLSKKLKNKKLNICNYFNFILYLDRQ